MHAPQDSASSPSESLPSPRIQDRIVDAAATGLFLGRMPFAPGTFGTALGLPIAWALAQAGPFGYMAGALAAIAASCWFASLYERRRRSHDPKEVVIDEVAGYLVAFTWLPLTWQAFAAAFVVFRFFDVTKPGPIGLIDRKLEGGFGTTMDDVAAGLATNVLLQIAYVNTDWLGAQWNGVGY